MNCSRISRLASIAALMTIGLSAHATQPPDTVTSDVNYNTAMGTNALLSLTDGSQNTAAGFGALEFNTDGTGNTALGTVALEENTTGSQNTAFGNETLSFNSTGNNNTAVGAGALYSSTTGSNNTAVGYYAFRSNTTGNFTTAVGSGALTSNTTGNDNTAIGYNSLDYNSTGSENSSFGRGALRFNTTGSSLTAAGYAALFSNTLGSANTAFGYQALYTNTTGASNIAVGDQAGFNLTTGSNNIDIGAQGSAGDDGKIVIGVQGLQSSTYIAGISNVPVAGTAVFVTSSGQLGVLASSERYKTQVVPMGTSTQAMKRLRPVSFRLKSDPNGALQYGLIAEEVAAVYPELVVRDQAGAIQGLRYDELAPMLLNEMQQQQRINDSQSERIEALTAQAERQTREIAELKQLVTDMRAGLSKLQAKDELLAAR
jgi:hypothetical protein